MFDRPAFLELFLRPAERDAFATWKEVISDRSFVNKAMSPVFSMVASWVPANIAPNVLTLSGSFAILQAWYFSELYVDRQPNLVTAVSLLSIVLFWVLGGVDGKHAQCLMNDTSLGELFKYVSDAISSIFLAIVMCTLLFERDMDTQWYCVQSAQLVLLIKHFSAFQREAGLRYFLIGPGELISWAAGLLMVRALLGLQVLGLFYDVTWGLACEAMVLNFNLDRHGYVATMSPSRALYIFLFGLAMTKAFGSAMLMEKHSNRSFTAKSLCLILCLRGVSSTLRLDFVSIENPTTRRDVVTDGLFLAMVTSDLIVAKMAGRGIHSWVVLMASMVVMPHLHFLSLCFVGFYYLAIFSDLANHMNLPLFQVCKNVYCDGIYDLCHVGHKNLFREALKLGNRLFVGVIGDKDANAYKRPPVMSAAERELEVSNCKCVTKVIRNAPCFGLTEEFIREHRIHVVAFGQEYVDRYPDPKDDPYYKVPRLMGIARPMPRTESLSTSDLIARIQSAGDLAKKSPT